MFLLFVHPNVIFEYFFHPFSSISEVQNIKPPITPALLGECLAHTGAIHVSLIKNDFDLLVDRKIFTLLNKLNIQIPKAVGWLRLIG